MKLARTPNNCWLTAWIYTFSYCLLQLLQWCHCNCEQWISVAVHDRKIKLKLLMSVIHFSIAVRPLVHIKSKGFNRIECAKFRVTNTQHWVCQWSISHHRCVCDAWLCVYGCRNCKSWQRSTRRRAEKNGKKEII